MTIRLIPVRAAVGRPPGGDHEYVLYLHAPHPHSPALTVTAR